MAQRRDKLCHNAPRLRVFSLSAPALHLSPGPDLQAIREAHRRISPHIEQTQVMISYPLDELAGALLYFKCENLQLSGSFKIRGAANAVFSLSEAEAARGVVTHSSGNHGAALALAAQMRGIRAWVVMPRNAPQVKIRAVEAYGADISFCEPTLAAREAAAAELLRATGGTLDSSLRRRPRDRRTRHGGARISGGNSRPGHHLRAGFGRRIAFRHGHRGEIAAPGNSGHRLRTGQCGRRGALVRLRDSIEPALDKFTIADGLRATLSPRTFAILRERVDRILLVTEEEIIHTMHLITEHLRMHRRALRRGGRLPRASPPNRRRRPAHRNHSFRRKSGPRQGSVPIKENSGEC